MKKAANKFYMSDKLKYNNLHKEAENLRQKYKKESWSKQTENGVKNSNFFKTINTMSKKGTLWVDGKNILDLKSKKVEPEECLNDTRNKWKKFLSDKFQDPKYKKFDVSKLTNK